MSKTSTGSIRGANESGSIHAMLRTAAIVPAAIVSSCIFIVAASLRLLRTFLMLMEF
ncbi:MAG: hypothetical protein M1356_00520 [Gammaproteobacteria bacterium]|nr:hypothetical protein [Gammaproteobacteria bacterium]